MLLNKSYFNCILLFIIFILQLTLNAQQEAVTINEHDSHFKVTLNYESGLNRYEMGQAEMDKVLQIVPEYETIIDSYIADILFYEFYYVKFIEAMKIVKPQVQQEFRDEIDGMVTKLSGDTTNGFGDGKLSIDEFYLMQLITDVCRLTQCSGVSVFGSRSATAKTITARILDWDAGSDNQLAQIQAVITINNGDKSLCSIGYLGFVGILSGFSDDGIFASILDSPSGADYSPVGKNSYIMDLRFALENKTTLDDVASFLKNPERNYSYNHLILLSDENTSKVLENNFSGTGTNMKRELRSDASPLNQGISWDIDNAIGVVNSFVLEGNHDNHTIKSHNYERWNNIKSQLQLHGDQVTVDEVKSIASYYSGNSPLEELDGDLYTDNTQQIIIFQPNVPYLEVSFRPKTGDIPNTPSFENIPISLNMNPTDIKDEEELPQSFVLNQNYPNPFNPETIISYQLPVSSLVQLKIYDLLGRDIKTLINKEQISGNHSVNFNAADLPSGVYIYQLTTGSFIQSRKMMLLK